MLKIKYILKIIFIFFISADIYVGGINLTYARWATPDDTHHTIDYVIRDIYVNKNGTSKTVEEATITILKENAKRYWSHFSMEYNSNICQLEVLEAKTIIDGQNYPVKKTQIENKPIASRQLAFDQKNRLTISYPKLDLHAKVFFKLCSFEKETPIKNYFHFNVLFGQNNYTKLDKTHIVSEIPLYIEKNDPDDLIEILQKSERKKNKTLYIIDIIQKRPYIQAIKDEDEVIINHKNVPWALVSSLKDWSEFGKRFAVDYYRVAQQPLPQLYQNIAEAAKHKATDLQKINIVTSLLTDKLNYLNNLKTIKGRLIPQPLQQVANAQQGDCKDFAMATHVILKELGINSKLSLVERGEQALPLPFSLPSPIHFNHAIVKVELPDRVLWIDPTNFDSMATVVFPDIADRKALVLDINHSYLEHIPAVTPQANTMRVEENWSLKNGNLFNIKGKLKLTGPHAENFTGLEKITSTESIKHKLAASLNQNYGEIIEKDIILPPLNSKIVEDLSFDYHILSNNFALQTNVGMALPLAFWQTRRFDTKIGNVSDIYLGTPQIVEVYSTVQDIKPTGKKPLNCYIESPWANFTRKVNYQKNSIIVYQKMELKKSWLTGSDLESQEYKNLKLDLAKHFNKGIAIVFEPISIKT